MIQLRHYQQTSADDIRRAYRAGHRAPLLVAPTGSGKTVLFSYIARNAALRGNSTIILVHRQELLRQTSRTLSDLGVSHGLIARGMSHTKDKVQVASVQTLVRRLGKLAYSPDLIVVDEAHHATGKSTWGRCLSHWPDARVLGVTATPERLDGQGLGLETGGFFDSLVIGPSVAELTHLGYLSPAIVYAPSTADLSGVHTRAGDYARGELADAMDKPRITGDAVAHYRKLGHQEPAVVFCTSIEHAQHTAEAFRAAGYQAASIDGKLHDRERDARIRDLSSGGLHVLTSCEIISEGTDVPVVSVAILLRPTQSTALALQQMGRALRPHPGKGRALILDHAGNVHRHGFPDDDREWTLAGKKRRAKDNADSCPIRQCDECYHVHRPAPACPKCGYTYPVKSREVEQVEGELEQLDPAVVRRQMKREQGRASSLEALTELGRARGYKNPAAWAYFVWNARKRKAA